MIFLLKIPTVAFGTGKWEPNGTYIANFDKVIGFHERMDGITAVELEGRGPVFTKMAVAQLCVDMGVVTDSAPHC